MDAVDLKTHLLHDLDAVAEGEDDAFLRGPQQVRPTVAVEVHAVDAATRVAVFQHPLRPVAEREDGDTVAADRHACSQFIHLGIGQPFRRDIAPHPGIQDAGAVDAQQHAEARTGCRMIHVGERIHARERVVRHLADDAIHHAGSTGCGGDLARVQHAQAQGVVGLVAGTIGHRRAFLETQFTGGGAGQYALLSETGPDFGQDGGVEAEAGKQPFGRPVLHEIPENAFGETAGRRADRPGKPGGHVFSRKHHFPDALKHIRFVFLHPGQFGSSEIAR